MGTAPPVAAPQVSAVPFGALSVVSAVSPVVSAPVGAPIVSVGVLPVVSAPAVSPVVSVSAPAIVSSAGVSPIVSVSSVSPVVSVSPPSSASLLIQGLDASSRVRRSTEQRIATEHKISDKEKEMIQELTTELQEARAREMDALKKLTQAKAECTKLQVERIRIEREIAITNVNTEDANFASNTTHRTNQHLSDYIKDQENIQADFKAREASRAKYDELNTKVNDATSRYIKEVTNASHLVSVYTTLAPAVGLPEFESYEDGVHRRNDYHKTIDEILQLLIGNQITYEEYVDRTVQERERATALQIQRAVKAQALIDECNRLSGSLVDSVNISSSS